MARRRSAAARSSGPSGLRLGHADALGLLEIIDGCIRCHGEESFRGLLSKLQALLPVQHVVAALGRREEGRGVVLGQIVNVSFPFAMAQRGYIQRSALARDHFTNYRMKFWADARRRLGQPRELVSLALDLGMKNGYTTGVHPVTAAAQGSMFCLSVPGARRDERTETILDLLVPHLHSALCRLFDGRWHGDRGIAVSAREKDVLGLMSQGKSSWEMSVILGISESTVNYHVYNVMQKLEVINRPQAVAVAAQLGLVEVG